MTSAAGALTDVLTRAVSQRLSQMWGQSIVVENRGGAGHNFAATAVKAAAADGYTLLASETGFATSQPHLYAKGKLSYDPETDFIPVAGYAGIPIGLLVHPSVPAKSVAELIALAKAEARRHDLRHRRRRHRAAHRRAAAGKSRRHQADGGPLPRRRARAQRPDRRPHQHDHDGAVGRAAGGQRPASSTCWASAASSACAQFPDVPTIAETVPGYEAAVSFGLFAPKGTPREILIKINADVQKIINDPEFHKRFLEPLVVQPIPGSLEAFAEYLRKDSAKWAKVIKAANLKID